MSRILVADDNEQLCNVLQRTLTKRGYQVEVAFDGVEAVDKIEGSFFDLLLTDLKMPKLDGMKVLKKAKEISPATVVIVVTAYGTVENAVEALREGAFDYVLKPFDSDELELKIKRALEQQRLSLENVLLKESVQTRFGPIIGSSSIMKEVYHLIVKVSPTNAPVLILGKSGTGKELAAREIHKRSTRADGPFIDVNCVALASGILESELFGHEKGAFTGAHARRMGKFEIANGGTLFLDEIGELSENVQVKLLRFLQEKEFQRVGGNQNIKVDVRILAATNRDLQKGISAGRFREDLYYRLNMFSITMPPLRERAEDLYELANHFVSKYNHEFHKNARIPPEVIGILKNYDWPGNVRELENVIAQSIILAEGDLLEPLYLPAGLAGDVRAVGEGTLERQTGITSQIDAIESEMIRKALEDTGWNQVKAAERLSLKRTSLQY